MFRGAAAPWEWCPFFFFDPPPADGLRLGAIFLGRALIEPLSVSAAQSMSASLQKRPKCCVAAKRRYVPLTNILRRSNLQRYSITSSARARTAAPGRWPIGRSQGALRTSPEQTQGGLPRRP
jgi:hypothetical protein